MVTVTDGNGKTVTYKYEVRDRVIDISHPNTSRITITYWNNGLVWQRTDGAGPATITFSYDRLGRLTQQKYTNPSVTQNYTYDNVGNMLTYQDSAGTVTYTYDVANQLKTLKEPSGTCPASGNPAANSGCLLFEYDNNGNETKRTYPGGAVTTTTRDNSGRAIRITAKDSAGTDTVDIATTTSSPEPTSTSPISNPAPPTRSKASPRARSRAYTYDSRNRLTKAEEKTGSTVSASWTYGYDAAGNRTTQTRAGSTGATAGTITWAYNDANQITSATGQTTTWTYDGAGNQTRNGSTGQTTTYNDRLQATTIGGSNQSYIGQGNTDRRASGSVTFQNGALGTMQRTSGSTTHSYTRAPDGSAIGYRASAKHYYLTDHLGSVVGMLSASGAYEGGYSYSPYGEERATGTAAAITANNLRYIAQHLDGNGIYKLGARYFDTSQGRFTNGTPAAKRRIRTLTRPVVQ